MSVPSLSSTRDLRPSSLLTPLTPLRCGPPRLYRPTGQSHLRHLLLEADFRVQDHAKLLRDPLTPRSGPSEPAAAILAVAFHTEAAKISAQLLNTAPAFLAPHTPTCAA